ncbi:MAG: SCO family protein [Myxococcota bacterium]|nr:SCO family protein [Myxococcota bacterium]
MSSLASRLSGKRVLIAMLVILLAAVIPGVFLPTLACREDRKLDDLGTVPAFSLVDETGHVFTEEALRGHPTIVNFIFTRCDTVCPITSMKMQRLEEKTRDKRGIAVKLLSISVDPTHDTPAQLAAFAQKYKANPARWRFVTGKPEEISALVQGPFMSPMDRDGTTTRGAPNIVHSGYFMLVDGDLKIRGAYDSNDVHRLDQMLHDARYLARTQRSGYKFGGT